MELKTLFEQLEATYTDESIVKAIEQNTRLDAQIEFFRGITNAIQNLESEIIGLRKLKKKLKKFDYRGFQTYGSRPSNSIRFVSKDEKKKIEDLMKANQVTTDNR